MACKSILAEAFSSPASKHKKDVHLTERKTESSPNGAKLPQDKIELAGSTKSAQCGNSVATQRTNKFHTGSRFDDWLLNHPDANGFIAFELASHIESHLLSLSQPFFLYRYVQIAHMNEQLFIVFGHNEAKAFGSIPFLYVAVLHCQ
jgi:hypothetical protein